MNAELYIGLISGTSMDGIDAVLAEFGDHRCQLHGTAHYPYPDELRAALMSIAADDQPVTVAGLGALSAEVAQCFAAAVAVLLDASTFDLQDVVALGSHGQTLTHQPDAALPFSLQIGDPGHLAASTGLTVVADFRNTDMALGGQGAPLVPGFHHWLFGRRELPAAIVNIGGIGNVTLIDPDGTIAGFDTGPGNTLLDAWCARHRNAPFDAGGQWAASGQIDESLLAALQSDPFFHRPAPKSTGVDYFNAAWLDAQIGTRAPASVDVQATLSELTAWSIASALGAVTGLTQAAICGGGAHNADLIGRIQRQLPGCKVESTAAWGLEPDWVEAAAFAWLARQRLNGVPSNVPSVTGARAPVSLGGVYLPGNGFPTM